MTVLYFPTYSTCDIWSEAVQYQASLEADFKRVCLEQEESLQPNLASSQRFPF